MDNIKTTQIKQGVQLVSPLDFLTRFHAHSLHTSVVQEHIDIKYALIDFHVIKTSIFHNSIIQLILFVKIRKFKY